LDERRRDGGTNSTLRTKEQGTHLTLNEHNDDDNNKKQTNGFREKNNTSFLHKLRKLYAKCESIHTAYK